MFAPSNLLTPGLPRDLYFHTLNYEGIFVWQEEMVKDLIPHISDTETTYGMRKELLF